MLKKYNSKEKWCPQCKKWLVLNLFPDHPQRPGGKSAYCKLCASDYRKNWLRQTLYGLNQKEYNVIIKKQSGKCALCQRKEQLIFDHCHRTKKFRGLVCRLCNVVLGRFKDDINILEKAIKYLNQHI